MALVRDWRAVRKTGERIERREMAAVDVSTAMAGVERLAAETDHSQVPFVRIAVDPEKGDRLGVPYTRRSVSLDPAEAATAVPAFEVLPGPGRVVRLELHPEGPVLVVVDRLEF